MSPQVSREESLVEQVLSWLSQVDGDMAEGLRAEAVRYRRLAELTRDYPSLLEEQHLGQLERSPETLLVRLLQPDLESGPLYLPLRAVMGDTTLIARIQLLRGLRLALRVHAQQAPQDLCEEVVAALRSALFQRLMEELTYSLLNHPDVPEATRHYAARELMRFWEFPQHVAAAFSGVMAAAWTARNHVHVTWGALTGAVELFRLLREQCPPEFVTFFLREEIAPCENQAFQEFLFGLPLEDLDRLRARMASDGRSVVDEAWVCATLGTAHAAEVETDPEAMYRAWRKRQRSIAGRLSRNQPGPRHTAEAYLLLHLLGVDATRSPTPPAGTYDEVCPRRTA